MLMVRVPECGGLCVHVLKHLEARDDRRQLAAQRPHPLPRLRKVGITELVMEDKALPSGGRFVGKSLGYSMDGVALPGASSGP
jgi:hypothetical protein